jgi:outer membrane protein assembly factor BamE (lipoprotein component of BamABCDE complex)
MIKKGMTATEVLKIMGEPQRKEHFTIAKKEIDKWWYRIDLIPDGVLSEEEVTKLLFINNELTGWARNIKYKKVTSENDLESGITIEQVEQVLGKPYYASGLSDKYGRLDIKYYLSFHSRKAYQITYENDVVKKLLWFDITSEIAKAKKTSDRLRYGQSMKEVTSILGEPDNITGDDINAYLWYLTEADNVVIYYFQNGVLKNCFATSMKTFRQKGKEL